MVNLVAQSGQLASRNQQAGVNSRSRPGADVHGLLLGCPLRRKRPFSDRFGPWSALHSEQNLALVRGNFFERLTGV